MHTSHPCMIVTETPESETVEPTEFVEPEPGVELVVDPEENQDEPEFVFGHFYRADPSVGEEYVLVLEMAPLSKAPLLLLRLSFPLRDGFLGDHDKH